MIWIAIPAITVALVLAIAVVLEICTREMATADREELYDSTSVSLHSLLERDALPRQQSEITEQREPPMQRVIVQ